MRRGGFTLMEMLVTLMLVSFATMLMFQMLGSYRIARERVQAQAGGIDRQALFQAWFRDSVNGLFAGPEYRFVGDKQGFSAVTLNPLYAAEGSPSRIAWSLRQVEGARTAIAYAEDDRERWTLPLEGSEAEFAYVDEAGKEADAWPPKRGLVKPEALPAMVVLRRRVRDGDDPLVAAVLGPLEPPERLYGDEQLD
jgi:general secretion pathway protein J